VAEVFGISENFARWSASTIGRAGWSHYMAFDRATAVAAASLFVAGDVGHLGMAATRESHRGQGAQHALIAQRIRDAAAQGCKMLVCETAEDKPQKPAPSFRNLTSLGFQLAYLRPNYIWKRG
jgi:ribosomal protein S18 acetylase RimI-like enzyme